MNITEYTYLLNKPTAISEKQTADLALVLDEFPYFQSARALRLKGLFNENSFRYNYTLKLTASHTTDRAILFDFITSDTFVAVQRVLFEKKKLELLDITVIDSEVLPLKKSIETIPTLVVAGHEEIVHNKVHEDLKIGQPLGFSLDEKHSFQEWLQLSRSQPIIRTIEGQNLDIPILVTSHKQKQNQLIDKFIEASPRMPSKNLNSNSVPTIDINKVDRSSLMTETLARIYLEQKKYQRAIQAYEILILKYPEKSSLFADRIKDIETIQQNNK